MAGNLLMMTRLLPFEPHPVNIVGCGQIFESTVDHLPGWPSGCVVAAHGLGSDAIRKDALQLAQLV